MSKNLVAFFSASGTTKRVAQNLASVTEADLFEIKPVKPYTADDLNWNNPKSRSSIEMKDPSSRPEIADRINNMDEYDTVFVGFPVWWYVAPTIINNFMESYDFAGKTVILFCTSGGSGLGNTEKVLAKCCDSSVKWLPGKRLHSTDSQEQLENWVKQLGGNQYE